MNEIKCRMACTLLFGLLLSACVSGDESNSEIIELCFDNNSHLILEAASGLAPGCVSDLSVNSYTSVSYQLAVGPRRLKKWKFISLNVEMESQEAFGPAVKVTDSLGVEHVTSPYVSNPNWSSHVLNLPTGTQTKLALSFDTAATLGRFRKLHIKFSNDDRFDSVPQGEFRFREVFPDKGRRTRILVVGNSTIRGTCNNVQDTIPYLLQSKADFNHPNEYEVLNYGIGSWFLATQVLAVKSSVVNVWPIDHTNVFKTDLGHTDDITTLESFRRVKGARRTIDSLKPNIIILASLWNDIYHILQHTHRVSCGDLTRYKACVSSKGTNCELHIPLIAYYEALYEYANTKSVEDEFNVAQAIQRDSGCAIPNSNDDNTSLIAELTYKWLIDKFIREVGGRSKIILMSLPFKGEGRLPSLLAQNPTYLNIGTNLRGSKETTAEYKRLELVSGIQNKVMKSVAAANNIMFADMSDVVRMKLEHATDDEYAGANLFCDPVHLNERGNEFIVDNIYDRVMAATKTRAYR